MRRSALAAGLVGVAALAVAAGCGDDERPTITGTGYSFQAPPGWDAISPDAFKELAAGEGGLTPTITFTAPDTASAADDLDEVAATWQWQ